MGACGNGLSDCLTLLYPPAAVISGCLIPSLVDGRVGDVSLMPRLWPAPEFGFALDAVEDMVLVRLRRKGLEEEEYVEELVEALDAV